MSAEQPLLASTASTEAAPEESGAEMTSAAPPDYSEATKQQAQVAGAVPMAGIPFQFVQPGQTGPPQIMYLQPVMQPTQPGAPVQPIPYMVRTST